MGRITRIKVNQNSDYKMVKGQPNYRQVEFETLPNLVSCFFHSQMIKPEVLRGKIPVTKLTENRGSTRTRVSWLKILWYLKNNIMHFYYALGKEMCQFWKQKLWSSKVFSFKSISTTQLKKYFQVSNINKLSYITKTPGLQQ